MAGPQETAYPRLKSDLGDEDLQTEFSPTEQELAFVAEHTRAHTIGRLGLLLHLKTFARLGRFVPIADIPEQIRDHVAVAAGFRRAPPADTLVRYDQSGAKQRHVALLREYFQVRPCGVEELDWLTGIAENAAGTKEHPADIINVLLEELVRANLELPGFRTLLDVARSARSAVNDRCFQLVVQSLTVADRRLIDEMLAPKAEGRRSGWNTLKQEPRKPTNKVIREFLAHVSWLESLAETMPTRVSIPVPKRRQYLLEARALDAKQMRQLGTEKRYALAALFIGSQFGKALDDVADLFIKLVRGLENNAQQRMQAHILKHKEEADFLVTQLKKILDTMAEDTESDPAPRLCAIESALIKDIDSLRAACDEHLAYAGSNILPFLIHPYRTARPLLFNCVELLRLRASTDDRSSERWIETLKQLRRLRKERVTFTEVGIRQNESLGWLSANWRRLIVGKGRDGTLDRRYLELALFQVVKRELSSGDLYVENGDRYDDYRNQLVDTETFARELPGYCEVTELESEPDVFTRSLRASLSETAAEVDAGFEKNEHVALENGRLVMKRRKASTPAPAIQRLDAALTDHLPTVGILDALTAAERWLNLHRFFRPLGGRAPRIEQLRARTVATIFCYGCNLGPTQTARSIRAFNRRQIAWLNLKHVTEETLDEANVAVINAYKQFELPSYWGSGRHASADGTKWDLYEQNLLSEYHIRYGGYGGIGYYHVSDTYMGL